MKTADNNDGAEPAVRIDPKELEDALARGQVNGGTKNKPRGKRQADLPAMLGKGVEKPSIAEIDEAAEEYMKWRDKRMAITPEEVQSKKTLLELMLKHKLDTYEFDDKVVTVERKPETVRVKSAEKDEPYDD